MELSEDEFDKVVGHVIPVRIKNTAYLVYSNNIELYKPFLLKYRDDSASWKQLFEYARVHGLMIVPVKVAGWKTKLHFKVNLLRTWRYHCNFDDTDLLATVLKYFYIRYFKLSDKYDWSTGTD